MASIADKFAHKEVFVTGGAGFVGSHIVDRLLLYGARVTVYDNFSTGREEFLGSALPHITLIRDDLLNVEKLTRSMLNMSFVFHIAANADISKNELDPTKCFYQNTVATQNVLEAMRLNGVREIAFASTGSVYDEGSVVPTPEDVHIGMQSSPYGASKMAGEVLIQAYSSMFDMQAHIFRFVSLLGKRYTHGHIFDFYKQLRADPTRLTVRGNGKQNKSYLLIDDCVDAMFFALENSSRDVDAAGNPKKVHTFNLGTPESCLLNDSISYITSHLGVSPVISYTGGDRGWKGDVPFIFLDTKRINDLGWKPRATIREAVVETVKFIDENRWVLERGK